MADYLTKTVIEHEDGTTVETAPQTVSTGGDSGYISYDTGTATLTLGKTGDDGKVTIDNNSVDIVQSDAVVASLGASVIELGKNSSASQVKFCGNNGRLYNSGDSYPSIGLDCDIASGRGGAHLGLYNSSTSASSDSGVGVLYDDSATPKIKVVLNGGEVTINDQHVYVPTVLYDNDSNTMSGAFTLSQSAANFTFLDICYKTDDPQYSSCRIWHPDGKVASLTCNNYAGEMYIKAKSVRISGTSINTILYDTTNNLYCTGWSTSTGRLAYGDFITITQVIGWK